MRKLECERWKSFDIDGMFSRGDNIDMRLTDRQTDGRTDMVSTIVVLDVALWWLDGRESVALLRPYWHRNSVCLRMWTRSQVVARTADRTASQHFGGHVTPSVTWPFDTPCVISYSCSFGTKPLSLTVSETFNVECNAMVNMTLIRPLNKGQGHSFWYQSISPIRHPIGCQ